MTIEIVVPGEPVPQPRTKAAIVAGHVKVYTPARPVHRAVIRLAAQAAWGRPLFKGPLRIDQEFVFTRPKRLIWKRRPMPRQPHVGGSKGFDLDNLMKLVLDVLEGVIYGNDTQVYDGRVTKWYAASNEAPHTKITIYVPEDGETDHGDNRNGQADS